MKLVKALLICLSLTTSVAAATLSDNPSIEYYQFKLDGFQSAESLTSHGARLSYHTEYYTWSVYGDWSADDLEVNKNTSIGGVYHQTYKRSHYGVSSAVRYELALGDNWMLAPKIGLGLDYLEDRKTTRVLSDCASWESNTCVRPIISEKVDKVSEVAVSSTLGAHLVYKQLLVTVETGLLLVDGEVLDFTQLSLGFRF